MTRTIRNVKPNIATQGANPCFEIRNATSEDAAEVFVYGIIGDSWGDGVTATRFAADLRAITAPRIDLHLNSPGGSVFDGQAIHNALARHPATVTVFIDGLAASIASVIALAGEKIVMASNALFMIHDPSGGVWGSSADMRKMAEVLDKIKDTIVDQYAAKTGSPTDDLAQAMTDETWYTAQEALDAGFIDEIGVDADAENAFDLSVFNYRHVPADLIAATAAFRGSVAVPTDSGQGGAPAPVAGGAPEKPTADTWIPGFGFKNFRT